MATKRKTVSFVGLSSEISELQGVLGQPPATQQYILPVRFQPQPESFSESQSDVDDAGNTLSGEASTSPADSSSRPTSSIESVAEVDMLRPEDSRSSNSGGDSKPSSARGGDSNSVVSLLCGRGTEPQGNDRGSRLSSRLPALALGALCIFTLACVVAVTLDQKWNLFGGEGAPPFADVDVGVTAARNHAASEGILSAASPANDTSGDGEVYAPTASPRARTKNSRSNTSITTLSAATKPTVVEASTSIDVTEQAEVAYGIRKHARGRFPKRLTTVLPRRSFLAPSNKSGKIRRAASNAHAPLAPRRFSQPGLRFVSTCCTLLTHFQLDVASLLE
ncbi:hypothetical protein HPB48_003993 [Haemaphysalis longicornis]|uniref:Transmembrane protein n=1 Tax=Haemaphysalis longicornis TaxID=44386 RepID=A0A9J6G8J2_HAELO|nr:hypothetical protein HPB48_003993 [Haemaphysalis longicornis]